MKISFSEIFAMSDGIETFAQGFMIFIFLLSAFPVKDVPDIPTIVEGALRDVFEGMFLMLMLSRLSFTAGLILSNFP